MTVQPEQEETSPSLISIGDWTLPTSSVRRTLTEAFRHAWSQLRIGFLSNDQVFESRAEMKPLSGAQRSRLAPDPDWVARSASMEQALQDRMPELPSWQNFSVVVAPPFSGVRERLTAIAERQRWQIIEPPAARLMTEQDAATWLDGINFDQPWVIPELGHFWLRHASGLAIVRLLLSRLASGAAGSGVIGCNSWCWAFWTHFMPGLHFSVLTPPALDNVSLAHWLSAVAPGTLKIRTTDADLWVLPADPDQRRKDQKGSGYLRDLAALSRGIPGVALAIWQRALRSGPDAAVTEEDEESKRAPDRSVSTECDGWVAPFDELGLPTTPPFEPSRAPMLVVHALLLHDGLTEQEIETVTGLSLAAVRLAVNSLCRFELLTATERGWFVSALGYPAARRQLQSDGFPVDNF